MARAVGGCCKKKLIEAGAYWARPQRYTEQDKSDILELGVPLDIEEDDFVLLDENTQAWQIFAACVTQWRQGGMSGNPTGLDYSSLHVVMQMMAVPTDSVPELFEKVRLIEKGALDEMSENRG